MSLPTSAPVASFTREYGALPEGNQGRDWRRDALEFFDPTASWIGWWFRGTIEEAKVGQLRQQQEKASFLSIYLRYIMARDGLDQSIPLDAARKALDDYIEGRVERGNITIHKGPGRQATVEFPDGQTLKIPPELSATSVPPPMIDRLITACLRVNQHV